MAESDETRENMQDTDEMEDMHDTQEMSQEEIDRMCAEHLRMMREREESMRLIYGPPEMLLKRSMIKLDNSDK